MTLLLSALLFVNLPCCVSAEPGVPALTPTWAEASFRVEGTKIIGPGNDEFFVKGVNVNGPGWVFPRDTLQDIDLITDVWKFNAVRLCAATKWDGWAANNNKDLDALIKAFTERRIVVILELHDYTGIWPPLEDDGGYTTPQGDIIRPLRDLKAWWGDKAGRFKDNPYVWFNIMNEPGSDNSQKSAETWFDVHDAVIEAIRATGAKNIIVLDDHGWGQASGYFGGKGAYASAVITMGPAMIKKHDNIVMSLHVYDAWTDGKNRFANYFQDAKDRGLCVILGEFGVGKTSIGQHNAVRNMYNAAIPNNIGRIYWAWDDGGMPMTSGENGRGYMIDKKDGTMPDNLSWVGELVWRDNRGLLTAPVPMYDLGLPLLVNGDFESGMHGWQNWGGCSVARGASHNKSAALTVKAGVSGGAGQTLDLKPKTTYSLKAWGKGNAMAGVKYRMSDNDANEHHNTLVFQTEEWGEKSLTFTTPDELFGATFFISKGDANATFHIDDIKLVEVTGNEKP